MSPTSDRMNTTKVPADLRKAFTAAPIALEKWNSLTPVSRRDFLTWIEGTKQPLTRARRIAKTCSVLIAGKRRPCCYAVVPMHLYKSLDANVKAKEAWKVLTPMEKRDLVSMVDAHSDAKERTKCIENICKNLAKRK